MGGVEAPSLPSEAAFVDSPMSKALDMITTSNIKAEKELSADASRELSDLSDTDAVPTPGLHNEVDRPSSRPPTGLSTPSGKPTGFGTVAPPSRVNIPHGIASGAYGLSPSGMCLDSPLLLPPNLAEPSPTTGTYPLPHLFRTNDSSVKERNGFHPPAGGYVLKPFAKGFRPDITAPAARMSPLGVPAKSSLGSKILEDGYCWRKYGQKHVKGHPFPRSYFKCTTSGCSAKKKVERNEKGVITSCIYKGLHTHAPPHPDKLRPEAQCPTEDDDESPVKAGRPGDDETDSSGPSEPAGDSEDGSEGTEEQGPEVGSRPVRAHAGQRHLRDDDDDDTTLGAKRRRVSAVSSAAASKAAAAAPARPPTSIVGNQAVVAGVGVRRDAKEPRLVVQTTSDVDVLDDGYRWRKYGQKLVKGNPYPRSYYKCTNAGCGVRKHVERSSADPKSVVTTYEGVHNHQPPAAAPARGEGARARARAAAAASAAAAEASAAAAAPATRAGSWGGAGEDDDDDAAPLPPRASSRAGSRGGGGGEDGGSGRSLRGSAGSDPLHHHHPRSHRASAAPPLRLPSEPSGSEALPSPSYVLPSPTPLDSMACLGRSSSASKPAPLLMDPASLLPSSAELGLPGGISTPKSTPACDPALFLTTPTTPTPRGLAGLL